MGSRANYVIIRKGKVTAHYEHWGADGVLDAALDGPRKCEQMATSGEEVDELMDWAYCEGGYLLDFDRKQALFFGYGEVPSQVVESLGNPDGKDDEDDEDAPPELPAARKRWSGWQIRFASHGVDDFSSYLEQVRLTGQIKTQPRRPPPPSPPRSAVPAEPPRRHGKKKRRA